ncbi:MAG: hypothetical protein EBR97_03380, partial [Firmicutes bacterium]|nr:hypothetical protein [Bacillota bacterium]
MSAGLALIASGFSAVPAQAADSLVIGLASGTSYNSVLGYSNELKLATVMSPGLNSNQGTLHYRVSNPSGAVLELGIGRSSTSSGAIVNVASGTNDGEIWEYGESAEDTTDADTVNSGFQTALTDFIVVPGGTAAGLSADNNFLTVTALDATGTSNVTVTVTAWLDTASNATNVQDSVEVSANTVTLNFYDPANITATTTLTAPV